MITEKDLLEAIAQCQGERNPNANTCVKLAAFYTILDHVRGSIPAASNDGAAGAVPTAYSYAAGPTKIDVIEYDGDSQFAELVKGRTVAEIMPIIDELMSTLEVVNPRLYRGVMRRL